MKPPKATGERQEIYSVLEEKANHQLTLRYPKAGEYRSAIVMKDVTGDGNDEAIAFYRSHSRCLFPLYISNNPKISAR